MNEPDRFDPHLAHLFRQTHTHVAAEPFVRSTLQQLAARRRRRWVARRALQAASLVAVILASPWLIEASALLSRTLEVLFTRGSGWLTSPMGMATAALIAGSVMALQKWNRY